jgi:hypothetical protein
MPSIHRQQSLFVVGVLLNVQAQGQFPVAGAQSQKGTLHFPDFFTGATERGQLNESQEHTKSASRNTR